MGEEEKSERTAGKYPDVPEDIQEDGATFQNLSSADMKEEKTEAEKHTTDVEKQRRQIPGLLLFFCCSLLYLEVVFYIGHIGVPKGDFLYSCLFVPTAAGMAESGKI